MMCNNNHESDTKKDGCISNDSSDGMEWPSDCSAQSSPDLITELNPNDVLLGRGSGANDYSGNRRFRWLVEQRKDEYLRAESNEEKLDVARQVLNQVLGGVGRFLQVNNAVGSGSKVVYEDVGIQAALNKCRHALREKKRVNALPPQYFDEAVEERIRKSAVLGPVTPKDIDPFKASREDANTLNPNDVLLGRGPRVNDYKGNRRFRRLIDARKPEYFSAKTNEEKNRIAWQVLNQVLDSGGKFRLMKSESTTGVPYYEDASEEKALKKCLHALRDKSRRSTPSPGGTDSEPGVSHSEVTPMDSVPEENATVASSSKRARPVDNESKSESMPAQTVQFSKEQKEILDIYAESVDRALVISVEEQTERVMLTEDEKVEVLTDMFGNYCTVDSHRDKHAKDDILNTVNLMKREIDLIPKDDKIALINVQSKCSPEEFSDTRLERFLRFADCNPKSAAERFVKYWECRRQTFGDDKYHLPMTLDGALRDDFAALGTGHACLLPQTDASGRQLLWFNVANHTGEGYTRESMIRAIWYVMEVAIQRDTQHKGAVRIGYFKNAALWHLDGELIASFQRLSKDCWPLKVNADHGLCFAQEVLGALVSSSRAVKGKDLRLRTIMHEVPDDRILEELAQYGILEDMLPRDVGGTVDFDIMEWIESRRVIETGEARLAY